MIHAAGLSYDISQDAYWLHHGTRLVLLPQRMTVVINGLLDGRPMTELPDFEREGLVEHG